MSKRRISLRSTAGFTIVELMVALTVLSVLLLVASVTLINLGKLYTKGNNEANTQNIARNILNEIVSQIQFSGNQPTIVDDPTTPLDGATTPSKVNVVCIGNQRYTYQLNSVLGSNPTTEIPHVLWRDTLTTAGGSCVPVTNFNGNGPGPVGDGLAVHNSGVELIPAAMRLTDFNVTPVVVAGGTTGVYTTKVTVAFGTYTHADRSDDFVRFTPDPVPQQVANSLTTCQGGEGSEFCAISSLIQTTVQRVHQ